MSLIFETCCHLRLVHWSSPMARGSAVARRRQHQTRIRPRSPTNIRKGLTTRYKLWATYLLTPMHASDCGHVYQLTWKLLFVHTACIFCTLSKSNIILLSIVANLSTVSVQHVEQKEAIMSTTTTRNRKDHDIRLVWFC